MKLFFSPGACSLASHILLRELGLPFELERVNLKTRKTEHDADYRNINPKGAVPAIMLDEDGLLTENAAILQYIADRKPAAGFAPPAGTLPRYRLQEWLHYIGSEVHKSFAPLFHSKVDSELAAAREKIGARFDFIETQLRGKPFLMGSQPSAADPYLYVMTRWANGNGIDLGRWPALHQFFQQMSQRPAVTAALEAEQRAKEAAAKRS